MLDAGRRDTAAAGRNRQDSNMTELELDDREKGVLADVLKRSLSDLHTEIAHTDSGEYRDMLKARRAVVEKVLRALVGHVDSHG